MRLDKFKLNRPLTISERGLRYFQKQSTELRTNYLESGKGTIRLNSTYLETADKGYKERGEDTYVRLPLLLVLSVFFVFGVAYRPGSIGIYTLLPLIVFLGYDLFKELFRYTHYPIRFNRQNRMVYVFQPDGTVLSARWESIFFCAHRFHYSIAGTKQWDIRGHVLAEDGETVVATFTLGYYFFIKGYVDSCWEFIRRYMEQGPEAVKEAVKLCVPIAEQRESFAFSFKYLQNDINPITFFIYGWLLTPLSLIATFCRYLAMHTSKIPVWPEEVNQACRVDDDDPIDLTEKDNPPWSWKKGWLFTRKGISIEVSNGT